MCVPLSLLFCMTSFSQWQQNQWKNHQTKATFPNISPGAQIIWEDLFRKDAPTWGCHEWSASDYLEQEFAFGVNTINGIYCNFLMDVDIIIYVPSLLGIPPVRCLRYSCKSQSSKERGTSRVCVLNRIIESFGLERTLKVIESSCKQLY